MLCIRREVFLQDRLKRQYGLDAFIGPLMITYRETTPLREPLEYTHTMEESIDGNSCRIELTLAVEHEKGLFRAHLSNLRASIQVLAR